MRLRRGVFKCLLLCCSLMTVPALAQTTPPKTPPGAPKQPGMVATPAPITTNQAPPSCLRSSPFATKDMDFVIQKVVAAGYTNVRGLYKGCDALWRGHALQNGIDTAI